MGNDLFDATLSPWELVVETLLAGLKLAESDAVEIVRALQRGATAGKEGVLDAFRGLGQVGGNAKAAEGLTE